MARGAASLPAQTYMRLENIGLWDMMDCDIEVWAGENQAAMNLNGFSPGQCEALLDLVVLGMYADGRLTTGEDSRVRQLLGAMGQATEYDRSRHFNAAVTRVRQQAATREIIFARAAVLAQAFTGSDQQQEVTNILGDVLASDHQFTSEENRFMAVVAEVFRSRPE